MAETKQLKNEIDEMFQALKEKKKKAKRSISPKDDATMSTDVPNKKKKKTITKQEPRKLNRGSQRNPTPAFLRYDAADGLAIYSEESLCIEKGGNTAQCPFDCWCCF